MELANVELESKPLLISVIMPCYNMAAYVGDSVASVFQQSWPEVELIVVDDGSDDDSVEILETLAQEHKGHMKLLFENRLGPYPARNLGLSHAQGNFIAFLDADDFWSNDCLEKLHQGLTAKHADVAYCGWQNLGKGAPGTEPYIPPAYEEDDMAAEFLRSCPWPIHATLIRRPVIDAVGGFSERHFSSMDFDLWLRILAHTRNMVRVPEVMAFYRWHGNQISSNKWRQVMDALQVRKDFVRNHPEQVAHMTKEKLRELTDGLLIAEAYRAYWKRDLATAQALFRRSLVRGVWRVRDLKYLVPSLLPAHMFRRLIRTSDRLRERSVP